MDHLSGEDGGKDGEKRREKVLELREKEGNQVSSLKNAFFSLFLPFSHLLVI